MKYKFGPLYKDVQQTVKVHENMVPTKQSQSLEAIFNVKETFGFKNLRKAANKKLKKQRC
jgi:hypothetical protein